MGREGLKILALFAYIFVMYVVSSLIFTKGFLLKRDVIERNSSCHVDFAEYMGETTHGQPGCWLHRRFDKAIVIVVDALRFDFMTPDIDSTTEVPYRNKLKTIHDLLERQPKNSRLYKFIADPPTTTLQRLKGLTTGSLPTFVDAGSNFASTEITEDNIVDQAVRNGRKVTFMGDDTWMSLFPGRFTRAYPFPSFNVHDLHTVDNGVLDNLYTELRKSDWDITIAHFLGVDHCGHRYGPNHNAMADKLTQMDQMIRNVTSMMDDRTVLFLYGDHGMTATGDHGGDSEDELNAGLFVYSPAQITSSNGVKGKYQSVSQIDFVPTLSLLLGLPIPFSNLGSIITELFSYCSWSQDSHIKEVFHSVEALRLNAKQVSEYIRQYSEVSPDLPAYKLSMLQQYLTDTETQLQGLMTELYLHNFAENTHRQLHDMERQYRQFVTEVKEICQGMWAKFDMVSMLLGILAFSVTLLVNVYILCVDKTLGDGKGMGMMLIVLITSAVFVGYCVIQMMFLQGPAVSVMAFILGLFDFVTIAIIIQIVRKSREAEKSTVFQRKGSWREKISLETFASISVVIISMCTYFSNSLVVNEDTVMQFCTQSLLWILCIQTVRNLILTEKSNKDHFRAKSKSNKKYDFMKYLTKPAVLVILLTFACTSCIRFSRNFGSCREEQDNCTLSSFLHPLSSIGQTVEGSKNVRYFISMTCLALVVYLPRQWLKQYGNLNGTSVTVLCGRYLLPAAGVCTVLYWAIQGLPEKMLDSLPIWQQVLLPQCVYGLVGVSLLAMGIRPLTIYLVPKETRQLSIPNTGREKDVVRQVYNHVKDTWEDPSQSGDGDQRPPVVYGLATVHSATIVYLGLATLVLLSLLLGDGLSPSLLAAVLSLALFLELFSVSVRACTDKDMLLIGIVTLVTMTTNFFYATGHHTTIPSIRFETAFIGFHGDWETKIIPAAMIHANMFASELFFTLTSSLLLLWPCTKGMFTGLIFSKKVEQDAQWRGDYVMYENPSLFKGLLVRLLAVMFLINALKLFCSMIAATILRRHLMVWKIFAPRFVYQGMSSFTVFGASLLMLLVLIRVEAALKKWSDNLTKEK